MFTEIFLPSSFPTQVVGVASVTDDQRALPSTVVMSKFLRRSVFFNKTRTDNFFPLCFEERAGQLIYSSEERTVSKFHQMI